MTPNRSPALPAAGGFSSRHAVLAHTYSEGVQQKCVSAGLRAFRVVMPCRITGAGRNAPPERQKHGRATAGGGMDVGGR
ncbi:hypothetical protein MAPG_03793 [Magnaporthiopsis poae ATCC 64411]|uniref:Uncharacterized protein n=1 Tax=Magnaporthiopsis poae (strain ATCC 64411 / 73-15) TaxID=644358 RepID=A0A0C4DUZ8_MAGP6|nr:hypothetical protein MAPG_03793 [Magnaporthiopsis poae ATCC 64411]